MILGVEERPDSGYTADEQGVLKATRQWLIRTNLNDTADFAATAIPVLRGDIWPFNPALGMFAVSLKCDRYPDNETLGLFLGTVEYSSMTGDREGSQDTSTDPSNQDESIEATSRPWTISFSSVTLEELVEEDFSDPPKPLLNLVLEKIPVLVSVRHTLIKIQAFKPITMNPEQMKSLFDNSVNDGLFLNYPARTLRVNEYNWTSTFDKGQWFWSVELTLEVNWNKWTPTKILHTGRWELLDYEDPVTHVHTKYYQAITDNSGQPMVLPLHCAPDGLGQITRIDPTLYEEGLDDVCYLEFNMYNVVNWTGVTGNPPIL